jgi:hypothetical protein
VNLVVRAARLGDEAMALRVWQEADAVVSTTDDPEGVATLLDHDPGALLIADADGAMVGTLIVGWDGWPANLYRLAVLPSGGDAGSLGRSSMPPTSDSEPLARGGSPRS